MNADEQEQASQDPMGGFGDFWGGRRGANEDAFHEEVFGDFENFFNMGGMGQERSMRGQDVFLNLDLDFKEAIEGASKPIKVYKKGLCTACKGSKAKAGTAPSKCFQCAGRGTINYRQGPMTIQMSCPKCNGSGATIKHACPSCRGTGAISKEEEFQVKIPKGINNGQTVRLSGKVKHRSVKSNIDN